MFVHNLTLLVSTKLPSVLVFINEGIFITPTLLHITRGKKYFMYSIKSLELIGSKTEENTNFKIKKKFYRRRFERLVDRVLLPFSFHWLMGIQKQSYFWSKLGQNAETRVPRNTFRI
jgi:hypothetical protein